VRTALIALAMLVAPAFLASCANAPAKRPRAAVTAAAPVVVTKFVYVPIDPSLTRRHPIAEGPPSMCPEVAAQRRRELEACNADNASTAAIQGTEKQ
jgi:hypothetical protein